MPALSVGYNATLQADGHTVSLADVPTGSGTLNLASVTPATDTIIINAAMAASTTPISISGHVLAGTPATSMPATVTSVLNGGYLEILAATAGSIPGTTVVQSGGIVLVGPSVVIPAHNAATSVANTDIFNYWNGSTSAGTLQFSSGSILNLGNGANWGRAITVGSAL